MGSVWDKHREAKLANGLMQDPRDARISQLEQQVAALIDVVSGTSSEDEDG